MKYYDIATDNILSYVTQAKWRDMTDEDKNTWGQEEGERIGEYSPNIWFIQTPQFLTVFDPKNPDPESEEFFLWFRVVSSM